MRILLCALGALLVAVPAAAQRRVPDNRFALDVGVIGATLGYANRVGGDWFAGAEIGGGGDFLNAMVLGGRHFRVEPRIAAGLFYENADTREFGINVAPLTVRITFP